MKVRKSLVGKGNKLFRTNLIFLPLLTILIGLLFIFPPLRDTTKNEEQSTVQKKEQNSNAAKDTSGGEQVLGHSYQAPQIYIYGGEEKYSSGGLISLASTDEPAVQIGGYNISGKAEVALYSANENALLDYLTHDADGKQIKQSPDVNSFQYITTVKQDINTANYEGSKVTLPLKETGIWYLKVKIRSTTADAFVLRSNIGVLTEEGDNEFIFWGQDLKTKRSLADGTVKILNLQDDRTELQSVDFNNQGIATGTLNADADIALVYHGNDRAIVPINLRYLNTGFSDKPFQPKSRLTRYFIFTDRPLYKPGDTVYFKAVLRDDDDARYTVSGGQATVSIYNGWYYEGSNNQPVYERVHEISPDGTIDGEYQLLDGAKVGYYSLVVKVPEGGQQTGYWDTEWSSNTISFDVEYFKKPEFSIDISTPQTELIAGDDTSFKISGSYFSGQPLLNQKVKYTVYSADFYEYQYLIDQKSIAAGMSDDYRYGYWYGDKVTEGTVTLNQNGEAEIDLGTQVNFNEGRSQVFSIEATIEDGSITPSFARKNILIYAGEYGIYRKDASYGSKINVPLSLPIALLPYRSNTNVGNINLTAKIHRENWIPFQEINKKYPSYKKEEEDLPQVKAKTDVQGNAEITFIPSKPGSYTITVEGKDSRGNDVSKQFYSYISEDGQPFYNYGGDEEITLALDKQKYQPADTARVSIFSSIPDRDVFLSLERGRVNRYQIVRLNGKNGTVEIPLENTDMPNIYVSAASFSDYKLDTNSVNIPVSADGKKILMTITPNSTTFGPGEAVTVNISTTDVGGNPVSANLALWAVDKAIFELSDNKLGDIFETYWKERNNFTQEAHSLEGITVRGAEGGGGCFAQGTQVLMSGGVYKNIENIREGEYVLTRREDNETLVKAKVLSTHSTDVDGYLILNSKLKVTPNHIMWVNNEWKEAGSIQSGDRLVDSQGNTVRVESIEWQRGKFQVYNLEIEKYHTYFAGNTWVHNQKGIERNAFKDTAYWNPTIHTDSSGRAQVSFQLPDNLTTWTLAAVGSTTDTKVGQSTSEIIVTKDVIVRPILPNILRTGDEILLSALVQNFTESDQIFDIDLEFDSGEVEESARSGVTIKSEEMKQLYWKVKPKTNNDKAKLIFSARVRDNDKLADIVTQEIPVRQFGFEEKRAETGEGSKTFAVNMFLDSSIEKSTVTLSLSPTIIGTLPTAMKYLINYPYGCVEQTTSRFVPAVIAKANQSQFADALEDKDIDDIIDTGLSRLSMLQQPDGGWSWWFAGRSDPFITSYVVEYVIQAKQLGAEVDSSLLNEAQRFLESENYYDYPYEKNIEDIQREELIAKNYGLTLLGAKDKVKKVINLANISPDLLSLVVMTNYLNGDTDPNSNGLSLLISMAKTQGDAMYWEGGDKANFGSKDASTALAIRAIILAGGDRELAVKGARYLTRVRQSEYWSNTYATAQVIRALIDLSKTGSELTPNYSYSITLDGKQIAQGRVSNSQQVIKDIEVPVKTIKSEGSIVSIEKNGDGQIYSTLVINEFRTDKEAGAQNHGLNVEREYINEKGEQYTLAVGDVAVVKLTVGGLAASEFYGVIHDELPSGMVPINQSFENEQYGYDPNDYYTSYDITDREITENGIVLSLYQIPGGERTYTYKARVVSEGTFSIPPATASLMYAPEVYGRSDAETIKITQESEIIPEKIPKVAAQKYIKQAGVLLIALIALLAGGIFILRKRGVTLAQIKQKLYELIKRNNTQPPDIPPTPTNPDVQNGQ